MIDIRVDGPFHRVIDPAFELVIPRWEGQDVETAQEADATVRLPDGTHRYATFMTLSAIERVMDRWQETGEGLSGRYFYCSDLIIIRRPGLHAMADAIRDLINTGEIASACSLLVPDDDP
jgi:hypothetical protein